MSTPPTLRRASTLLLLALFALCVLWELWLAPLRPGGSSLALKALPLLIPLPGIWQGRRYTYQWGTLAIWLYFVEGVVRAMSDAGLSAWLGGVEVALCLGLFGTMAAYARLSAPSRMHNKESPQ